MRRALAVCLVACGCSSAPAPIDVTIVAGASLSDAVVARMRWLDISVSGAESADRRYPLANPFADHRQERVVYDARDSSGAVVFSVDAQDDALHRLAHGELPASLQSGAPERITIVLATLPPLGDDGGANPDAAPDLAAPDLAVPDLSGPCGGAADGTPCGAADACHKTPTCLSGVCVRGNKPDGTVCAATANPCQNPGTCSGGSCGAITNKGAGTVCAPKSDACHTDGVCNNAGVCGAQGVQPNGFSYDGQYFHRCCGGALTATNTAQNCGACGLSCNGRACISAHNGGNGNIVYCDCVANAGCWSNCCSTFYGLPDVCAAGNCATNLMIPCPGGATNSNNGVGPYYCHY